MATIQKLIPLVASSAILLAVDGLYLNNIGIATFKKNVELIQKSPLEWNMYGALLSYVCVISVLYYFIISQHKPVLDAFLLGILLYGTFDMTNISIFKQIQVYVAYNIHIFFYIFFLNILHIYILNYKIFIIQQQEDLV